MSKFYTNIRLPDPEIVLVNDLPTFSTSVLIRVRVPEPLVAATIADTVSVFDKIIDIKAPRTSVITFIFL